MGTLKQRLESLFDYPATRTNDHDTSHAAADRVAVNAGTDRMDVLLTYCRYRNGLTDYELASIMGRQQNSVGKRRGELRDAGFIEKTNERRPAPSGSQASVWRITEDGKALANLLN